MAAHQAHHLPPGRVRPEVGPRHPDGHLVRESPSALFEPTEENQGALPVGDPAGKDHGRDLE